jgi:hypothetical protein
VSLSVRERTGPCNEPGAPQPMCGLLSAVPSQPHQMDCPAIEKYSSSVLPPMKWGSWLLN